MRSARILIVGDEPLSCRLIEAILRREQFIDLRHVVGGDALLDQLDGIEPDLVLLDLQMSDRAWGELCGRIRSRPRFVDLPILVQTTSDDRKEMARLFAAGVSGAMLKPIMPTVLVAHLTVHLERFEMLCELRDYHERTSQELDAARRMQFDLLPSRSVQLGVAAAAGLRIGSYCRPSSEIGGDLWGILPITTASFGVFLADFAGHGVTAALNTFRLHALLLELKALHGDPVALVAKLNDRLAAVLKPGQFATFFYAVIDTAADRIRFASAGAPSPIVTPGYDHAAELREASGLPLGIVKGTQYPLHECPFGPGALLLLFSDGLSEFPDSRGIRIGEEGLRAAVDDCRYDLTPRETINRLLGAAGIDHDSRLPDDTTVICLDRRDDAAVDPAERGDGIDSPIGAHLRML